MYRRQTVGLEQAAAFSLSCGNFGRNIRVVRSIMNRRGKTFDGYHPSKAAPSGRTPLQLAIARGVTAMVRLFIKDATTHDAERCWKTETMNKIKVVLQMKVSIYPLFLFFLTS